MKQSEISEKKPCFEASYLGPSFCGYVLSFLILGTYAVRFSLFYSVEVIQGVNTTNADLKLNPNNAFPVSTRMFAND